MSIISTPSFKSREHCPSHQPGHFAVKSKTEIFNYYQQTETQWRVFVSDANETKPFWDREDRFNFFPFSRFLLWQNDTFFIQSLKQKNAWWSNEGQIVFQPADAVADRLKPLQQSGWTKGLALKTLWATFPEKTSSYLLCPQNTHVKRTFQWVVLLSPKVPCFPLFAVEISCDFHSTLLPFSWSHTVVELWLYFSSVSVYPRELIFLFPWIKKCFP